MQPRLGGARRWFRIHLSTAILLMFAAGVLLWANCRIYHVEEWTFPYTQRSSILSSSSISFDPNQGFGWPCCIASYNSVIARILGARSFHWNGRGIAVACAVAAGILVGVACISEFLIARRMRR